MAADRIIEVVKYGTAELVPDPQRRQGWTLRMDGVSQSYVDLAEPSYLASVYTRLLGAAIDQAAPAGEPLRILHLGGGAMTMPRYVSVTRPGSAQVVVDHDQTLMNLVLRHLPLPADSEIDLVIEDARRVVEATEDASFDIVIADAIEVAEMAAGVAARQCAVHVSRILRSGGIYLVNVPDLPDLNFARRIGATLREVFDDVCLVREPVAGVRFANAVFAAGWEIPRDAAQVRGQAFHRFVAAARPLFDAGHAETAVPAH